MSPHLKLKAGLVTAAIGFVLTACSLANTPNDLIVGDWNQIKTASVSAEGVDLEISNSTLSYRSDGTSQTTSTLLVKNVPEELSTYQIISKGVWRIEGKTLIEQITDATVSGRPNNPQSTAIAAQMQDTIQTSSEYRVDILALTEDKMTIRNTVSNSVSRFERR